MRRRRCWAFSACSAARRCWRRRSFSSLREAIRERARVARLPERRLKGVAERSEELGGGRGAPLGGRAGLGVSLGEKPHQLVVGRARVEPPLKDRGCLDEA